MHMDFKRALGYITIVSAMLFMLAIHCDAQEATEMKGHDHTCTVNFAGGTVWSFGKDGDNFNRDWGLQAGGGIAINRPEEPGRGVQWFFTANYMYARLNATSKALAAITSQPPSSLSNAISAHGSFSAVTIDPTVRNLFTTHIFGAGASLYASGGFGWLHRGVGFNGQNPATLLQPAASTLGTASSDSGVFDLGTGMNITPGHFGGLMIYVEGRVYQGVTINRAITLVPLSAGVRW